MRLRLAPPPLRLLLCRLRVIGVRGGGILAGADRGEPALGDAKRERSPVLVTPPDWQGALRRNFFD